MIGRAVQRELLVPELCRAKVLTRRIPTSAYFGNFLPNGCTQVLRVHENASRVIPDMDHRTVQLERACIKRICASQNEKGCMYGTCHKQEYSRTNGSGEN